MAATLARVVQRFRINILRGIFILLLPLLLFTRSAWGDDALFHEIAELVGALLIIGGVLGRFWSILYSGGRKNREVLQVGPYSMCRHPLYLFSTTAIVGFGIITGSIILTVVFGGLTFLILMLTAKAEERFLTEEFGPAYGEYAARVPMIVPDPTLFHTPPTWTFEVSHLRRNFQDAMVFLALLPLAEMLEYLHESGALPSIALY